MGFFGEFRQFALKGNMVDLAVGLIIGTAFGNVVQSLIKDVIMPVVSLPGKVDYSEAKWVLREEIKNAEGVVTQGEVTLGYGNFITVVINFVILAFVIFLVVKAFNTARRRFEAEQAPPPPPGPSSTDKLLMEIRDSLKAR
jgi:large conductance mechanosensitive channel